VQGRTVSMGQGRHLLSPGRWFTLVDASKAFATSPPNLSSWKPDFVVLSYYKLFGYPTGLGALIARREALGLLRRPYFGGGAVLASAADRRFHRLRPGARGFEDGSLPFLAIPAAVKGFQLLERLGGFEAARRRGFAAARRLAVRLAALRHGNGTHTCVLHGRWPELLAEPGDYYRCCAEVPTGGQLPFEEEEASKVQGGVVSFSVLHADGSPVGYREVERVASLKGCTCGLDACVIRGHVHGHWGLLLMVGGVLSLSLFLSLFLPISLSSHHVATLLLAYSVLVTARPPPFLTPFIDVESLLEAGHVCSDDKDVVGGRATGVVRASFGYASSLEDADAVADVVETFFLEEGADPRVGAFVADPPAAAAAADTGGKDEGGATSACSSHSKHVLDQIWVYPVKSCGGCKVPRWPIGPSGLLHDRRWAVADVEGRPLGLKACPRLARVVAEVDIKKCVLRLSAVGTTAVNGVQEHIVGEGPGTIEVPLADFGDSGAETAGAKSLEMQLCGKAAAEAAALAVSTTSSPAIDAADAWLSTVLDVPCRLVESPQIPAKPGIRASGSHGSEMGFANSAHLLLVSRASLRYLAAASGMEAEAPERFLRRFRPNLVLEGMAAPVQVAGQPREEAVGRRGGRMARLRHRPLYHHLCNQHRVWGGTVE
jgi:molybdenum cofactor sulfurtransferase